MSTSDYAGFWLRFVAFVIDALILSVVYLVLLRPLFSFFTPVQYDEFNEVASSQFVSLRHTASSYGYAEVVLIVITLFYHSFMESSRYQASFGKLALELKVTDYEGGQLGFLKALTRNAAKAVSSFVLMIGYLMAAFTAKKQALHDIIASTLIVKK